MNAQSNHFIRILLALFASIIVVNCVKCDSIKAYDHDLSQNDATISTILRSEPFPEPIGQTSDLTPIAENQQITYTINAGDVKNAMNGASDAYVTFSLTSYAGDSDLFVATEKPIIDEQNHTCDNCILISTNYGGDIASIHRNDPNFPKGDATFYVAVFGYRPSNFTLTIMTSNQIVPLDFSMPIHGESFQYRYKYFKFTAPHSDISKEDIIVSVTPLSGDPDLYISTHSNNKKPNQTNNDGSATEYDYDIYKIENLQGGKTYYVSVYGYTHTQFLIFVRFTYYNEQQDNSVVIIPEGSYIRDEVEHQKYDYYYIYTNPKKKQHINIDVDLLGNQDADVDIYAAWGRIPKHEQGKHDFHSTTIGEDTLDIPKSESKADALLYVGVYAFTGPAKYQIAVKISDDPISILPGFSSKGLLEPDESALFSYNHLDPQSGVVFTAEWKETSDQVALYSKYDFPHPSKRKNDKIGVQVEPQVLRVYYEPEKAKTGYYYFKLVNNDNNKRINYTVELSTNQTASQLKDGKTLYFQYVPQHYFRYFVFNNSKAANNDLAIAASPYSESEVSVFVSTKHHRPNETHHQWSASTEGSDTVVISKDDLKKDGATTFFIGVRGDHKNMNYFDIFAKLSNTTTMLQEGKKYPTAVTPQNYTYFEFKSPSRGKVTIEIELENNNDAVHLFMSRKTKKPTQNDYDKDSWTFGTQSTLQFEYQGSNHPVYLGVLGTYSQNSTSIPFEIIASIKYIYVYTNVDTPLVSLQNHQIQQFRIEDLSSYDALMISTNVISGNTRLFVSDNGHDAGPDHYFLISDDWPDNAVIHSPSSKTQVSNKYHIGVQAEEDNTIFTLDVVKYPGQKVINVGDIHVARVPINTKTPMIYVLNFPQQKKYYLEVQDMRGFVEAYGAVNRIPYGNSSDPYQLKAGELLKEIDTSQFKVEHSFYLAFYASSQNDQTPLFQFSIFGADEERPLSHNYPIVGYTLSANNDANYFNTKIAAQQDLFARVESCTPMSAPQAYFDFNHTKPARDSAKFKSAVDNSCHKKYCQTAKIEGPKNPSTLDVTVKADNPAHIYSLVLSEYESIKPIIQEKTLEGGESRIGREVSFEIPKIRDTATRVQLNFTLYARRVSDFDDDKNMNFYTACGVQRYGKRIKTVSDSASNAGKRRIIATNRDFRDGIYRVNIIVTDAYGIHEAYEPAWFDHGDFRRDHLLPPGMAPVAIIFLVIFLVLLSSFMAIFAYLGIGFLVKQRQGYRGADAIPHIGFWTWLCSCGRTSRYQTLSASSYGSTNF